MQMVHKNEEMKPFAVLLCVSIITSQTLSLEEIDFYNGRNISITFYQGVKDSLTFTLYASSNIRQPFYEQGRLNTLPLLPQQRGRFEVLYEDREGNISLILLIQKIHRMDSGVYQLVINNTQNGQTIDEFAVLVKVHTPPSKAKCSLRETDFFLDEVECNATLGSKRDGILICYQNSSRAPMINGEITFLFNRMMATFYVHTNFFYQLLLEWKVCHKGFIILPRLCLSSSHFQ